MKKLLTIILTMTALTLAAIYIWHGVTVEAQTADASAEKDSQQKESCNLETVPANCEKIMFNSLRDNGTYDIVLMNPDGSGKVGLLPPDLSGFEPRVTPAGDKVVFASGNAADYRFYVINTDGSNLISITGSIDTEYPDHQLSPDGSKMIFTETRPNSEYDDIYIMNLDGTGRTNLTPQAELRYEPMFNADGSKIFYSQAFYFNDIFISTDLYSMSIDGTNKTRLIGVVGESIYPFAFSPDGSKLVVAVRGTNDSFYAIDTMNPDGGNRSRLITGSGSKWNPSFSPDGSKILFENRIDSTNDEFYTMNAADGSNLRNLTNHPQDENRPRFNSEGSKIIFDSDRTGESQLFSMNPDGSNITNLSSQNDVPQYNGRYVFIDSDVDGIGAGCDNCPATSNVDQLNSDNDSLGDACDADDDNDGVSDGSDNCPINSNPSQLDTDGDAQGNACDADDDNDNIDDQFDNCPLDVNYYRVVFSNGFYIWTMNEDASGLTRLTFGPLTFRETEPEFNRAGSRIVFQSNRSDNRNEIYSMNADGTNQIRLTNIAGNNRSPSYSPDGNKIAFISGRTRPNNQGSIDLYVMNADGNNQIGLGLPTNTFNVENPTFNQDGTRIAYHAARLVGSATTQDIYAINPDGTNETRLTTATGVDNQPSYSRDGSKIAFVSFRGGDTDGEIYIMNADGTNQTRLTNDTREDRQPTFTPDGTKITFTDRGSGQLWRINVDGTGLIRLTNGGSFGYEHPSYAKQPDADGDGRGDACDASFEANTPTGTNVAVQSPNANVSFSNVSQVGTTSFTPITPNQNQMPQGYTLCPDCPAYEITTTAVITPPITVCLGVPAAVTEPLFLQMRLLHGENGVLVDHTTNRFTDGNGQRFVCGSVNSLSPFILASNIAPTAANVSILGRVLTSSGRGLPNAVVSLTDSNGSSRMTRTSTFGFYRFNGIEAGQMLIINVRAKGFEFEPRILSINEDLTNVNFIPIGSDSLLK